MNGRPHRLFIDLTRQSLRVECPACGAAEFEVCRSPTARPHKPHLARWSDALVEEIQQATSPVGSSAARASHPMNVSSDGGPHV